MAFERDLLASFPPRLAGPFGVCLCAFFFFTFIFMSLAKRPVSERLLAKAKQDRQAALKAGRFEPSVRSVKSELAVRTISWIHAAAVGQAGFRILFLDPHFAQHGIMQIPQQLSLGWTSPISDFYIAIGVAYFLGDVIVIFTQYEEYGLLFCFHASCGLLGLGWAMLMHQAHAYCLMAFCFELSTPFVNNIFFLRTYAPHWKLTNLINGLVLVFVFIGMRIVLGLPAGWRMFSELRGNYAAGTLSAASLVVMSGIIAILCALNVLWAFKLLKGFIAVASGGKVKGPANPYKKD